MPGGLDPGGGEKVGLGGVPGAVSGSSMWESQLVWVA
jgi:hypothetical protein